MSQTNIKITEENEMKLQLIEKIGRINDVKCGSKEKQINLAIQIAYDCITYLDDESLMQVANLKKTI